MEDVLEVYQRPPDDRFPVVCVDETSKQLVSETRVPQPPAPGQPVRYDYEYRRQGAWTVCRAARSAMPPPPVPTNDAAARSNHPNFSLQC